MSERDFLDYASFVVSALTLLVTAAGLSFVVFSLKQSGRQQRIEAGPYVRVDIGSATEVMSDYEKPVPIYHDGRQATNLASSENSDSITISAWFRNYQTHPLGMALGVTAVFLVEVGELEPVVNDVRIAYLEVGKPVLVDIVQFDRAYDATVQLLSLTFQDFYDEQHEHRFGIAGTNALHGRLIATYEKGVLISRPEGRSRGEGVDFD
jgi:hypothetical protein